MDPFALGSHYLCSAHYLACASAAAYLDLPEAYAEYPQLELERVHTFAGDDLRTRGFVAANETAVVVAFRGTDQPADWITNLDYKQVECCGGKVHRGFAEALACVWDELVNQLRMLRDQQQKIWLTGHSLGGALATLAAARLSEPFAPHAVFSFGQPRVGNPGFAKAYDRELWRFVNHRDIVPNFPLPGIFNLYRHVGKLYWLDAQGHVQAKRKKDWLAAEAGALAAMGELMVGRMTEAQMKKFIAAGIRDHKIGRYIEKLRKNIRGG